MRPGSEINSALDLLAGEAARSGAHPNLAVARDVLTWVMGGEVDLGGDNAWLCAYLLRDPDRLDNTPPEAN